MTVPASRILVAIDDSPSSDRLLDYVAGVLRGGEASVVLCHVVSEPPPHLEPPPAAIESRAAPDVEAAEARFQALVGEPAAAVLERGAERLAAGGLSPDRVETRLRAARHHDLAAEIVAAAREAECGTIAVGRSAAPWYEELVRSHVGEEIGGQGLATWVVE